MATIAETFATALRHHQAGQLPQAERIYRQILSVNPNHADSLHLLGMIASQVGKQDAAIDLIQRATAIEPRNAVYRNNLGSVLRLQRKLGEAMASFQRAVDIQPDFVAAHYNLGLAQQESGKLDDAVASYRRALEINPDLAEACNNLGNALGELAKYDEAVASYRRALEINPGHAEAHNNLGNALREQGKLDEAVASYRRALKIKPDYAEAHNNLGNPLQEQGKLDEAIDSYQRALEIKPDYAEAHNSLGKALQGKGQLDEAVTSYRLALDINPDYAEAYNNLGNAIKGQGMPDDALPYYRRALQIKPDFPKAHSNLLLALQYREGVTLAELAQAHAEYERLQAQTLRSSWRPHERQWTPDRPLRLGFVSPDLGKHPVGFFLIRVMENFDPKNCECVCYNDRSKADDLTKQFQAAATHWREVAGWSDQRLAEQIRDDQVDILFDLAGHTAKNRLLAFARKPAPIQISWVGYPGTTGLSAMDYILADRYMIPPDAESHYREGVLRMPEVFSCFEPPEDAPEVGPLPASSNGFVTFGSFNNTAKITSQVVATWADILHRTPGSRVVLKYRGVYGGSSRQRLVDEFVAKGIDADRLLFPATTQLPSVLPLYHQVDLALDPFPYGGATTTCEAMWMGVPVITCPGPTFAGRYAYSFLTSSGLGDLVAQDRESYVERAVSLAGDLPRLEILRAELRQQMASSPLCDGPRFAADFVEVLRDAWQNRRAGAGFGSIPVGSPQDAESPQKASPRHASQSSVSSDDHTVESDIDTATFTIPNGVRVCVPPSMNLMTSYVLAEQDDWFEDEMTFIRHFVRPGMKVIDIGANFGCYALTMARIIGDSGEVWAFEPTASTCGFLRESIQANALHNIELMQAALSDRIGEATLFTSTNSELNSLSAKGSATCREKIRRSTLDHCLAEHGWKDIDFIKLDAEGEETKILQGGAQTLDAMSPLIMFELKHGETVNTTLVDSFKDMGYNTYRLVPGLNVLIPFDASLPFDGYLLNLFCCKEDKAAVLEREGTLVRKWAKRPEVDCAAAERYIVNTAFADSLGELVNPGRSGDSPEYEEILNSYVLSLSPSFELPDRLAYLMHALHGTRAMLARGEQRIERLATFSRIAFDAGERSLGIRLLSSLIDKHGDGISLDIRDLLLPASPRYDDVSPNGRIREWLFSSVIEQYLVKHAFSTYFTGKKTLPLFGLLNDLGHMSEGMRKRQHLIGMRFPE